MKDYLLMHTPPFRKSYFAAYFPSFHKSKCRLSHLLILGKMLNNNNNNNNAWLIFNQIILLTYIHSCINLVCVNTDIHFQKQT